MTNFTRPESTIFLIRIPAEVDTPAPVKTTGCLAVFINSATATTFDSTTASSSSCSGRGLAAPCDISKFE
ncbi:hypothetical protein Pelo_19169 [Pelomyxa schiedti]|nr:hypothetical protein Pelo_19169 [Pelomyxa schiedti]